MTTKVIIDNGSKNIIPLNEMKPMDVAWYKERNCYVMRTQSEINFEVMNLSEPHARSNYGAGNRNKVELIENAEIIIKIRS